MSLFTALLGAMTCACGAPVTNLEVADFEAKAADPAVFLVDVRTPEEYAEGHLRGAANIDWNAPDFLASPGGLPEGGAGRCLLPDRPPQRRGREGAGQGRLCRLQPHRRHRRLASCRQARHKIRRRDLLHRQRPARPHHPHQARYPGDRVQGAVHPRRPGERPQHSHRLRHGVPEGRCHSGHPRARRPLRPQSPRSARR